MKLLVVLAAMLGLAIAATTTATTQWPEHDCNVDHRPVPGNPHGFEVSDRAGTWTLKMCEPDHLVFVMAARCFCGWSDPELTYGNCSDVNRPSQVSPEPSQVSPRPNYMFEYWHPVDNVWKERNCHDTFPAGFLHDNDLVFFNVTGCRCDWIPGHPVVIPPVLPDNTLVMDIEMNKQPPNDSQGSFVQPDCPIWKTWPPKVNLSAMNGRDYMRCNTCTLKSWYLQGNEKKDVCLYFGLYSTEDDEPSEYRVVLSDSCASIITGDSTVFQPTFLFEYRANPLSIRVTYHGLPWTGNPGGSGVNNWSDVVLSYRAGSWFILYVNGVHVILTPAMAPTPWPVGKNPFFKISDDCQLNICGNPLDIASKYTGCVYWFQAREGAECPMDVRQ